MTRLATLAVSGRITVEQVHAEVSHLRAQWRRSPAAASAASAARLLDRVVSPDVMERLDRFDRVQLEDVLAVCRRAPSLSAAGRVLFDRSRERKKLTNDADRLRKYLARFELDWATVRARLADPQA
jgi:transcriptional regulatory protein RtcR